MKKYNIPISWIQQGLITVDGETLQDAHDKAKALDVAPLNLVGQTAPNSTRIAYSILKNYVPDEHLTDEVVLYTSSKVPQCPFCDKARKWFDEKNIKFREVDIILDKEGYDHMFDRTQSMNMPQIEIGNEVIVGFTENEITNLCVKYGLIIPEGAPDNGPIPGMQPQQPPAEPGKVVKLNKEEKENA